MIRNIQAKTILSSFKAGADTWFGLRYNLNLYRGCQHGCIYCDSRSLCYRIKNFSDIEVKENALQLLEKEIRSKREKGTIGFGSMNDPYMPLEKEKKLTRGALEIIARNRFPVHIITKSDLITRDMDLLTRISSVYAAVSVTITTPDDGISKVIEPGAPVSSDRFRAISELSKAGIYCGVTFMPVLPWITDKPEYIRKMVYWAKEAGAKYIIAIMGLTLRDGQREFFYSHLDHHFPGLKTKYEQTYGRQYSVNAPLADQLWNEYNTTCASVQMPQRMNFYKPESTKELRLFE